MNTCGTPPFLSKLWSYRQVHILSDAAITTAGTTTLAGKPFSRSQLESLLKRRVFYTESFEIDRTSPNFLGDNHGFYDYGPPG